VKRFTLAVACVLAAVAALAFFAGPYVDAFPTTCPYRMITGLPCVFCGMSHAVAFAVRGDFAHASAAHPAWFVVLPMFAAFIGAMAARWSRVSWALVIAFVVGTLIR